METSSSVLSLVQRLADIGAVAVPKPDAGAAVKESPQEKFVKLCMSDIAALESDEKFGKMYTARKGGGFVIMLRSGIKTIEIVPGRPHYQLPNVETAVEFYRSIIASVEDGELDDEFA